MAVLVACAAAGAVASPVVGASSSPPAGTTWVQVDGDMVAAAGLVDPLRARSRPGRATPGYETSPSVTGNLGSYDVRLADSPGIESLRPEIEEAARRSRTRRAATSAWSPGRPTPPKRRASKILLVVSTASPCSASPWIGCGGVQTVTGSAPNLVATSGKVWFRPDLLDLDGHNRQHVVSHEMGHALGLVHYDALHDGEVQVMHKSSYDAVVVPVGRSRRPALPP